MNYKKNLMDKFVNRSARIGIVGLGYVGLPLAVAFAEAGFEVYGVDIDHEKVSCVQRGESHIQDIPSSQVARLVQNGKLHASTDFAVFADLDTASICVPTPLRKTGDPDVSYILAATKELSKYMHPGMVVVLESTSYPGTTREILLPELGENHSLVAGEDFFLAFSPERVDPGRKDWTTMTTPKVIGGITQNCSDVAAAYYAQALERIVPVSSAEAAEMTKLLENTFRMINIGLVNEMALMCGRLGIDVWEVIEAASTKPFGFMKFTPGPGLGGHCIPIDPLYLSWKLKSVKYTARFIELASEINTYMPRHVMSMVQDALNSVGKPVKGMKILALGVAYKPDIDDLRESPALDIIGLLMQKGAEVMYHDPHAPIIRQDPHYDLPEMYCVLDLMAAVRSADCVVIITNHSSYDYAAILDQAQLIVDTRNALGKFGRSHPKVFTL